MATTVYFIRHGETYFNRFARLQGWSDTPLTAKGHKDAVKIAKVLAPLKIDYFFSSDLKRAIDTAQIIIDQLKLPNISHPTQKKCFREVFYGSLEGHSNEEGAIWAVTSVANVSAELATSWPSLGSRRPMIFSSGLTRPTWLRIVLNWTTG